MATNENITMTQQTLAMAADQGAGFEPHRKPTRREVFLGVGQRRSVRSGKVLGEILTKLAHLAHFTRLAQV